MPTIFSKIIAGDIPCHKVAEDDRHIAFLDVKPLKRGHTLVVPKRETDYIFDLEDDELAALHIFAKGVAAKIRAAVECKRVGVAVVGLEVPHVHIHLIPLDAIDDTNFARPRLKLSQEEFEEIRQKIAG
ncbi:MAG: HIT family protein [bacterium]|nr:HIT family protein [bacterium]